jgi:membrane-bound ClpP family serine protease
LVARAAEALSELVFPDVVTKADLQTEIAQMRAEMRTETASLRTEIASLKISIAQWIIGAMFVNVLTMVGAVAAVWQLAGRHPWLPPGRVVGPAPSQNRRHSTRNEA